MAKVSYPKRSLAAEFHDTWWSLALRGLAAIAFGVIIWSAEELSLATLGWSFALYALVEGALALAAGAYGAKEHQPWMLLMIWGLIGVTAGVVTFASPGDSSTALAIYIAAFALAKGVVEMILAGRLRTDAAAGSTLGFAGLMSLGLGVLMVIWAIAPFPVNWAFVIYGLGWGALAIVLAMEARRYETVDRPRATAPVAARHHQR